jgi:hypothetical protein
MYRFPRGGQNNSLVLSRNLLEGEYFDLSTYIPPGTSVQASNDCCSTYIGHPIHNSAPYMVTAVSTGMGPADGNQFYSILADFGNTAWCIRLWPS